MQNFIRGLFAGIDGKGVAVGDTRVHKGIGTLLQGCLRLKQVRQRHETCPVMILQTADDSLRRRHALLGHLCLLPADRQIQPLLFVL